MITVNGPLVNFSSQLAGCTNRKTVIFSNTSTGGHLYYWDFGDGTTSTLHSPTHTFPAYQLYYVSLSVTDTITGCVSTTTHQVFLVDLDAQFTANDTSICRKEIVSFTAQTNPFYTNYSWDFGDGGIGSGAVATHQYDTAGTYTVRLIVTDVLGCKDTLIRTAYIHVSGPTTVFSGAPLTGCAPLSVVFTDSSTGNTGYPIVNRRWYFGNGQTLTTTGTSNTHVYGLGTFTVTLVTENALGCKDSVVKPAYISVTKPTAAFTAPDTTLCVGMSITFTNTSATATSYDWDFGDGTTSTATAPSKSWSVPGNYTIRLIATNAGGCKDTLTRTAYVNVSTLTPSFTMSDSFATCPPLTVQFTNTSAGTVLSQWTLGNGSASSQQNPSAVYTLPGVYTVKLKVTNVGGCVDSITKTITILGPSGTFSYTPQTGCAPIAITFNATAVNTSSFTWDMNNGQTTTTSTPSYTHTFTTPGVYVPIMVLSNGSGCNVAYQGGDTIKVSKAAAGFISSVSSLCNAGSVSFTDTSSTSTGTTITSRSWNFGNSQTSTLQNPSVYYGTPGTYTVTQVVTNSMGCTDTATHTVTVLPKPTQVVTGTGAVCSGSTLPLVATGGVSYAWSPANGLSCTTCSNPTATVTGT
ncbi:MAG TPA: PKD domain-containing protein, partial [Fibrella sp.]